MVQVLIAAINVMLAGLGWLITRWVKRDALTERVDRRLKLIALHQRMTKAGLTRDDLERLERRLSDRLSNNIAGKKADEFDPWSEFQQCGLSGQCSCLGNGFRSTTLVILSTLLKNRPFEDQVANRALDEPSDGRKDRGLTHVSLQPGIQDCAYSLTLHHEPLGSAHHGRFPNRRRAHRAEDRDR